MTLVGTTVGHIRIVEPLGQGGMGEVYTGYDETLKRRVALKAIRDERRLDPEPRRASCARPASCRSSTTPTSAASMNSSRATTATSWCSS